MLVLHGGKETSVDPVPWWRPGLLRARWIAAAVRRPLARHGVAVWTLRFAVQGWNGADASPVVDARWALERIAELTDGPVVIIGHSMGGRTALRVAGEPAVRGVVALAPWVPAGEPVDQLAGRAVLIAHGTADRVTAPADSATYARRAEAVASSVDFLPVEGEAHDLVRRARFWHRLCARTALRMLDP